MQKLSMCSLGPEPRVSGNPPHADGDEAARRTVEDVWREASDLLQEMRRGMDLKAHRWPNAKAALRDVLDLYIESRVLAERSRTG